MSERTHLLVQQWLQHSPLDQGPVEELEQAVADYPYFSAAQLLLLKRLDPQSPRYASQKQMSALHVYNPLYLEVNGQTFEFPFETEAAGMALPETMLETADEEPVPVAHAETNMPPSLPQAQKENETFQAEAESTLPEETSLAEQQEPAIRMPSLDLSSPAAKADITFEPFHTVDYFASQGIKLSQTDNDNDRFGRQLKSFTEWLKTMKKLPTTAITHNTDGAGEKKVEHLAAHSLQGTDIITESMAEVWVKQGNIEKASEVYNKLSLQNPSKKAYFAAKIDSLKKHS